MILGQGLALGVLLGAVAVGLWVPEGTAAEHDGRDWGEMGGRPDGCALPTWVDPTVNKADLVKAYATCAASNAGPCVHILMKNSDGKLRIVCLPREGGQP